MRGLCCFLELRCITQGVILAQVLEPDIDGKAFEPGTEPVGLLQLRLFLPGMHKDLL